MKNRMMRTVFDWEHFAIYLAGPIDFAEDGGRDWRDIWTQKLIDIGLKSPQIYNPCKKPCSQFNLDNEADVWKHCRDISDWELMEETASQVMHIDLRLVEKSDIVLVNMPKVNVDSWRMRLTNLSELNVGDAVSEYYKDLAYHLLNEYAAMRVPTYGTIHEIVFANQVRKPIFMVWEGELKTCSAWLMRLVGHKNIFGNVDDLVNHLQRISQGEQAFDAKKWLLIQPRQV